MGFFFTLTIQLANRIGILWFLMKIEDFKNNISMYKLRKQHQLLSVAKELHFHVGRVKRVGKKKNNRFDRLEKVRRRVYQQKRIQIPVTVNIKRNTRAVLLIWIN